MHETQLGVMNVTHLYQFALNIFALSGTLAHDYEFGLVRME